MTNTLILHHLQSLIHPEFLNLDKDSGYQELIKDLQDDDHSDHAMEPTKSAVNDGKSSPTSVSDLSSTASAASMDSPSSSSMTSISLSTPPPAQLFSTHHNSLRRTDDLCETLQSHMFIQSVIPEEHVLAIRSSQSSLSSGGSISASMPPPVVPQHPEQGHTLDKISQNLKEIDDFISVTEEIMKRDRQRDEELYAREKQRKLRQSITSSSRPNSMRTKSSSLRRKFSMIERSKQQREAAEAMDSVSDEHTSKHSQLRQTKSTDDSGILPVINRSSYPNPTQFLGLQSRLNFQNGRVECIDPELREKNCIQKTHELVQHIIKQERVTPLVQPEHVDRVLLRNFRRGSVAVTTEDFEMTNVCISEDQQAISEGTGPPPIEEATVIDYKELEPVLSEREMVTDIEAPPPKPPLLTSSLSTATLETTTINGGGDGNNVEM